MIEPIFKLANRMHPGAIPAGTWVAYEDGVLMHLGTALTLHVRRGRQAQTMGLWESYVVGSAVVKYVESFSTEQEAKQKAITYAIKVLSEALTLAATNL